MAAAGETRQGVAVVWSWDFLLPLQEPRGIGCLCSLGVFSCHRDQNSLPGKLKQPQGALREHLALSPFCNAS